MTPEEQQLAIGRLRELASQLRLQTGQLDDVLLLLKTTQAIAIVAELLAAVIEDQPEVSEP